MTIRLLVISLVLSLSFCSYGQTLENIVTLRSLFTKADSIILISHETTYPYGVNSAEIPLGLENDTLEMNKYNRNKINYTHFIINGDINRSIIVDAIQLSKIAVEDIVRIITRQVMKKTWSPAKCDEPHHSILIYKKGKLSYFDICFSCFTIHTSKDVDFTEFYMDDQKWDELKGIFIRNNINFSIKDAR